jgi:TRAP-type C4-dicarboxylate transport system permease small subunit
VWLWVCSILVSVLSVILGLYLMILYIYYYNHDYTPTQHDAELDDYRDKQGWIYGFLYVFLSIYCIAGYAFLYKTM